MSLQFDDTIAALASPPGPGARGIVRISGPDAKAAVEPVFQPDDPHFWQTAQTAHRHPGRLVLDINLRGDVEAAQLPTAVYLWPTRRSFTGQPMAEIHCFGAPPLLELTLRSLYQTRTVRPARPGEFTLRAFLAGRIDLVQAEAVLGVIDAHDHQELQLALEQLAGGISGRIGRVRNELLDLLADLEAGLDFADEDIEFVDLKEVTQRLVAARSEVTRLLDQAAERMQTTGRLRLVLAGLPNAGKSSLFNALAGQSTALVSESHGTTRDYLAVSLDCRGLAVELIDTAGWEELAAQRLPPAAAHGAQTSGFDGIGAAAQRLRGEQVDRADLVLWCTAAELDAASRAADAAQFEALNRNHPAVLRVGTKSDLVAADATSERSASDKSTSDKSTSDNSTSDNSTSDTSLDIESISDASTFSSCRDGASISDAFRSETPDVSVSAVTGEGLDDLLDAVAARLTRARRGDRQLLGSTASRCRDSLVAARDALTQAETAAKDRLGEELVAMELRDALEQLGAILGTVYTDDILDRVFSKFCIGK